MRVTGVNRRKQTRINGSKKVANGSKWEKTEVKLSNGNQWDSTGVKGIKGRKG